MSSAPLEIVTETDLQNLAKCLWDWRLCGNCDGKAHCDAATCPWTLRDRVNPALSRYTRLCSYYMPIETAQQALNDHLDLLAIIKVIKDNADVSKKDLMEGYYVGARDLVHVSDQEKAFNLAVSVLLYMNCGMPNDCADTLEDSADAVPWILGESVIAFIDGIFVNRAIVDVGSVLMRKAGLRFQATDDLHSHLRLDLRNRTVFVYDSTSVLEEILAASKQSPQDSTLPRALILEVLHTIYKTLFPPGRESEGFASYLSKKHGFQEKFLRYKIHSLERDDDPEIDYSYFGERLLDLQNELKDPSARNWFERLFEGGTKSAERKMLMATTIGVFIAVTIGLFGLVIAGFQAWVGYQQWKHPVQNS
jgi:hypothetical protein